MTRRIALLLTLVLVPACGGGSALLRTPAERLHAAVKAAQAVYDPDSAGGTGYGTTATLLHRMGSGPYGTPRAWPDDLAFRPGVVYVGLLNGGRQASFWIVGQAGRAQLAVAGPPHDRVSYQTRSAADVAAQGMVIIRPGVLSGDMIRSALERSGFHWITLSAGLSGHLPDGVRPFAAGGTRPGSPAGDAVAFTILGTAADARKAASDAKLPPHHVSVVVGTAWISYTWSSRSADRSEAFAKAVAALRREARTGR